MMALVGMLFVRRGYTSTKFSGSVTSEGREPGTGGLDTGSSGRTWYDRDRRGSISAEQRPANTWVGEPGVNSTEGGGFEVTRLGDVSSGGLLSSRLEESSRLNECFSSGGAEGVSYA